MMIKYIKLKTLWENALKNLNDKVSKIMIVG